jgi:uncharacterized cupin superfamily protein
MKNKIDKALNKMKECWFKFGVKDEPVSIKEIAYDWESFGAIEGDSAKRLDIIDKEFYTITYRCPKGVFKKHYHKEIESGIVLKGEIIITTSLGNAHIFEGGTFCLKSDEWHEVRFIKSDNVLILNFHPPFESDKWEGKTNCEEKI